MSQKMISPPKVVTLPKVKVAMTEEKTLIGRVVIPYNIAGREVDIYDEHDQPILKIYGNALQC